MSPPYESHTHNIHMSSHRNSTSTSLGIGANTNNNNNNNNTNNNTLKVNRPLSSIPSNTSRQLPPVSVYSNSASHNSLSPSSHPSRSPSLSSTVYNREEKERERERERERLQNNNNDAHIVTVHIPAIVTVPLPGQIDSHTAVSTTNLNTQQNSGRKAKLPPLPSTNNNNIVNVETKRKATFSFQMESKEENK
jgi:hypothetical protein